LNVAIHFKIIKIPVIRWWSSSVQLYDNV